MQIHNFSSLAQAYPVLAGSAGFKIEPEDFIVREQLGFVPSGEGEHVFLYIRKRLLTTELLAKDLARQFGVDVRDVAYSGLKDKHAVTEQWFSVPYPIKKEIPPLQGASWQVLECARHGKKLRRGVHQSNAFEITLRDVSVDRALLEERLNAIKERGFPNYFGEQRLGRDDGNVKSAVALFNGEFRCKPFQRSMYYSAARSYLFNRYLSERVANNTWDKAIAGDKFNLDGSNALFGPEPITDEIVQRVAQHDIHPVGPLLGDGESGLLDEALSIQQTVETEAHILLEGLRKARVETALRPLRADAKSLNWQLEHNQCRLSFELRSGSFATALIRELVNLNHAADY